MILFFYRKGQSTLGSDAPRAQRGASRKLHFMIFDCAGKEQKSSLNASM
jgi:hypothetical protein